MAVIGPTANGVSWLAASAVETLVIVLYMRWTTEVSFIRNVVSTVLAAAATGAAGLLLSAALPATLPAAVFVGALTTALFGVLLFAVQRSALLDAIGLGRRIVRMAVVRS